MNLSNYGVCRVYCLWELQSIWLFYKTWTSPVFPKCRPSTLPQVLGSLELPFSHGALSGLELQKSHHRVALDALAPLSLLFAGSFLTDKTFSSITLIVTSYLEKTITKIIRHHQMYKVKRESGLHWGSIKNIWMKITFVGTAQTKYFVPFNKKLSCQHEMQKLKDKKTHLIITIIVCYLWRSSSRLQKIPVPPIPSPPPKASTSAIAPTP